MRATLRTPQRASIVAFTGCGSALSLRQYARLGSALSLVARCRGAMACSVLTVVGVGSSLSVRSSTHVGRDRANRHSLSLFGNMDYGSVLSCRHWIQEARNAEFCPSQEKFHTVVLKDLKYI